MSKPTQLVNLRIIKGYSDKTFKPENKVTRAEFITIFANAVEVISAKAGDYLEIFTEGF